MGNGKERIRGNNIKTNSIQSQRWKPGKKFCEWIRAYKVYTLGERIRVERKTIYGWLNGEGAPREPNARAIVIASLERPLGIGPLNLEDIYGSSAPPPP